MSPVCDLWGNEWVEHPKYGLYWRGGSSISRAGCLMWRGGSSFSRAGCYLAAPLRRGRGGFVVGTLRVAGRRRAVLSVGPRRRAAGRKGSANLRGYGEQQGQEGLATHRETERGADIK